MQSYQSNLIEALDRVDEFLSQNTAVLETTLAATARRKFTALRERMVTHMKSQDGTKRVAHSQVNAKSEVRDRLIDDHMRPLVLVARVELAVRPTPPAFLLPSRKGRYATIIAAGYGMAQAAEPYREAFAAAGLNADFIERLVEATDALRDSVAAKSEVTARRVEATAGLRKDGRSARRYLWVVDSLVRRAIRTEGALLSKWEHVSRVAAVAAAAAESAGTPVSTPPVVTPSEGADSNSPSGAGSSGRDGAAAEKGAHEPDRVASAA